MRKLNQGLRDQRRTRKNGFVGVLFLRNGLLLTTLDFQICLKRCILTECGRVRHWAFRTIVNRGLVASTAVLDLNHHIIREPLLPTPVLTLWGEHHLLLLIPVCHLVLAYYHLLLRLILLGLIEELCSGGALPLELSLDGIILSIDLLDLDVDIFELFIFFIDEI